MPVQQANSELSEKTGMLQAEKKILEEEIKRWKNRTQVGGPSWSIGPMLLLDAESIPAQSMCANGVHIFIMTQKRNSIEIM